MWNVERMKVPFKCVTKKNRNWDYLPREITAPQARSKVKVVTNSCDKWSEVILNFVTQIIYKSEATEKKEKESQIKYNEIAQVVFVCGAATTPTATVS